MRTNKGRTNKGQITFFRKIKWGLIRDKYLEKFSTKQNIAYFLFRLAIFGKKLISWCEGLGRFPRIPDFKIQFLSKNLFSRADFHILKG